MGWLITKYLVTAGIIVAVSEVAKRNDKLGALFVALPTVTILAIIWLGGRRKGSRKVESFGQVMDQGCLPTQTTIMRWTADLRTIQDLIFGMRGL